MENVLFLGVPILKHIRVFSMITADTNMSEVSVYYPLAQPSCGGDIWSVRSYVCSPFVITLLLTNFDITSHIGSDSTSNEYAFQVHRIKVKVTVAIG